MITNLASQDYEKRILVIDQLTRVCADCGSYAYLLNEWICGTCHSHNVIEMLESEVADFREALALAAEVEKTQRYIDGTCNTQDELKPAPIILIDNRLDLFDLLAALAQLPAAQPQPETSRAEYVLSAGELVALEAGTSELNPDNTQFGSRAWMAGIESINPDNGNKEQE